MNISQSQLEKMLTDNPEIKIDSGLERRKPSKPTLNATPQPVVPNKGTKRHETIRMPYPGCVITENHYLGRNGKSSYVKPEAREWQNDLIQLIKNCKVQDWTLPLKITVSGVFKNDRERCDLHNLKILYDSIQKATGLNDKDYHTETIPGVIDKEQSPHLDIKLEEI
jgi:hypothetical protein